MNIKDVFRILLQAPVNSAQVLGSVRLLWFSSTIAIQMLQPHGGKVVISLNACETVQDDWKKQMH